MIWGALSSSGVGPLYLIKTKVNAAIYQDLSEHFMLPDADKLKPVSHCPEIDTRWPYEYGIDIFAQRWPRIWSTANAQSKQV